MTNTHGLPSRGRVNDYEIYSDRPTAKFDKGIVTFDGGSWCDANTGEIHAVGSTQIVLEYVGNNTFLGKPPGYFAKLAQRLKEEGQG